MSIDPAFEWTCHPVAAELVGSWAQRLANGIPFLEHLRTRMRNETGTRLVDWIDHLVLPRNEASDDELAQAGYCLAAEQGASVVMGGMKHWQHAGGLFPSILVSDHDQPTLTIMVESVSDFLAVHQLQAEIDGQAMSPLRITTVASEAAGRFRIIERHGSQGFVPQHVAAETIVAAIEHAERFRRRTRGFLQAEDGFHYAAELFDQASRDIGMDWACDLYFAAERSYWQSRNHAARVQKERQDRLGLGWANHDHHTYRSSREHFAALIALLERMGFQARERFYGGAEAGWGAQVMEQPRAGIVVFADVDLSPQEVTGDFAHQGLPSRQQLGTVGLWCALHGEAMLQAGLHHLECQFDFEAARLQLAEAGVVTMAPFTNFTYLKQAFTEGEVWRIDESRIAAALQRGALTEVQAERFREHGTIGSHLEILQRDDGYKGFNQTGISEIIRETDPRHAPSI